MTRLFIWIVLFTIPSILMAQDEPDLENTIQYLKKSWFDGGYIGTNTQVPAFYSNGKVDYLDGKLIVYSKNSRNSFTYGHQSRSPKYSFSLESIQVSSIRLEQEEEYFYLKFRGDYPFKKDCSCNIFRWTDEEKAKNIKKALTHAVKLTKGPESFFEEH